MKRIRMIDFRGGEWFLTSIVYGKKVTTLYFLNAKSRTIKVFYRYNCCASYFANDGYGVRRVRIRDFFPKWNSYNVPVQ